MQWNFLTECAMQGTVAKPPGEMLTVQLSKEELLNLLESLHAPRGESLRSSTGFPSVGIKRKELQDV